MNILKIFAILIFAGLLYTVEVNATDFTRPSMRVIVNGQLIQGHGGTTRPTLQLPARKFAEMLGAQVTFERDMEEIIITYNGRSFMPQSSFIEGTAYIAPVYLSLIFDHTVEYFDDINLLAITRNGSFNINHIYGIIPTFDGYTEEDLHWLSRIIFAEARGEPFEGMIAVGSVVMNRTYHYAYPNTVREVIFDRRHGVQFSPTSNGSINNTPCMLSFIAAVDVLQGKRNASDALFFMNPRIAGTNWISRNRDYAFSLANHSFFY